MQVAALPKDALVEIEAIAIVGPVEDEFVKDGKRMVESKSANL
jgi:hypothetical protein